MGFGTRMLALTDKAGKSLVFLGEAFWVVSEAACEVSERRVDEIRYTKSSCYIGAAGGGSYPHTGIFVFHKDAIEYARAKLNVRLQKLDHETH